MSILRFVVLSFLVAGCSSSTNPPAPVAPGSVAQGGECQYETDCAPVVGGIVTCVCSVGHAGSPRCSVEHDVPLVCGSAPGTVCPSDQTCVFDAANPSGACKPSAAEGADCTSLSCLSSLFCNKANKCEKPRAVGEPCNKGDDQSCAAPAFCARSTMTCTAPVAVGGACDPTVLSPRSPCVPGARCSGNTSKCVEPQPNGAACTDPTDCQTSYCSPTSGRCETKQCHG